MSEYVDLYNKIYQYVMLSKKIGWDVKSFVLKYHSDQIICLRLINEIHSNVASRSPHSTERCAMPAVLHQ